MASHYNRLELAKILVEAGGKDLMMMLNKDVSRQCGGAQYDADHVNKPKDVSKRKSA